MKTVKPLILSLILLIGLISCQKKSVTKDSNNNTSSTIQVDNLSLSEDDFGFGCTTNYYKKGDKAQHEIYMQTSSKDEKYWVNYISINGKREVFNSQNDDTKLAADEKGYTLRLENESYIVEILANIGESNIESDSALASGTLTITKKSDHSTTTIKFEGGTAC